MGVPDDSGRDEFDCHLRDELDHVGLLRESFRPAFWRRDRGDRGTNFSASTSRFRGDADLLVHSSLDVPPQNLPEDMIDQEYSVVPLHEPLQSPWKATAKE